MTTARMPHFGFRVLGPAWNRRRLVDAGAAFRGYASCDPQAEVEREAFLSAFTFTAEFRRHLEDTSSTRDYPGPCWTPFIWWDLDVEHDLDSALGRARRLSSYILERYFALNEDDLLLFFSGSKGAHVGLPVTWEPAPSATFHRVTRRFAEALAAGAGVTIDSNVYSKVNLFRAPNSKHPKTGLHKRKLSLEELLHLSAERIRQLAVNPVPFEMPVVTGKNEQAASDWQAALQAVDDAAVVHAERRAATVNGAPHLNRQTLAFLSEGAPVGERHPRLFQAAANLAEFGCPPELAHALLTEAGLDTGLTPSDVRRQIDCGLNHFKKGTSNV